jgi:hypothetical protein
VGGGSESGVGTDSEGWDAEEAGLEGVGGGNNADVVRGGLNKKTEGKMGLAARRSWWVGYSKRVWRSTSDAGCQMSVSWWWTR